MKLQAILFDLDGTLLPMDQDVFIEGYCRELVTLKAPELGVKPELMMKALWLGVGAMVQNPGPRTNEDVFWEVFSQCFGRDMRGEDHRLRAYYENEYENARRFTAFQPLAAQAVALAREKAEKVILATNPVFPLIATSRRMQWAGLREGDFELVTTYENSRGCKPNPIYYREIFEKCGLDPARCLMVGNDTSDDGAPARLLGMDSYLITDCLIDKTGTIREYKHGTFSQMLEHLSKI